jgi:hypothetical protein
VSSNPAQLSGVVNEEVSEIIPVVRVDISDAQVSITLLGVPVSKTYMYFILLRKLGWMLSGCHLKMYMTNAQLKLANTGQAFLSIFAFSSGENLWVKRVGVGVMLVALGGSMLSFASASITRANT